MKQTNNAIKFLMAQYRAIFQNAYFKGLATAAVVTMAMAAGQAQANKGQGAYAAGVTTTETTITIDGADVADTGNLDNLANYSTIGIAAEKDDSGKTIDIIAGTAAQTSNFIKSDGTAANTVYNADILNIKSGGGITIDGNSADSKVVTAKFSQKVNILNGTVLLNSGGSNASAANLISKEINVGDGTTATNTTAQLQLSKLGTVGATINATDVFSELNTINLKSGGTITSVYKTNQDTGTINAGTLNITGGDLVVANDGATGAAGTKLSVNLVKGTVSSGKIEVQKGSELDINFKKALTAVDGAAETNKLDLTGGSISGAGAIVVSGAGTTGTLTLKVKSGATAGVDLTKASGDLKIASGAIFETNKANLDNLAASSLKTTISGGTLKFSDTANIDLDKDKFNTDGSANKIGLSDSATILGNELTLNGNIGKVTVEATKLNLKNSSSEALTTTAVKASKTLVVGDDSKVKTVTLSAGDLAIIKKQVDDANTTGLNGDALNAKYAEALLSQSGDIVSAEDVANGKLDLSDDGSKLDVVNGTWTNNSVEVVLGETGSGKGTINVGTDVTTPAGLKNAASLTFADGSKLNIQSGDVVVGQASSDSLVGATLDISALNTEDGSLVYEAGKFTANKNGTIIADASLVGALATGKQIDVTNGGTLELVGEAEISTGNIAGSATDAKLSVVSGGKLVGDTLTIKGADVAFAKGANVEANTLVLDNYNDSNKKYEAVSLNSGNYIASQGLRSTQSGLVLTVNQDANVTLGTLSKDADGAWSADTQTGTSNFKFKLAGNGTTNPAALNVNAGTWTLNTAQKAEEFDIDLTDGALTVGVDSTENKRDANGDLVGATLVAGKVNQTAAGKITINEGSKATFTEFVSSGTADNTVVKGTLTLVGKKTDYVAANPNANPVQNEVLESYGVSLKDVKVSGPTAVLELQKTALGAIDSIAKKDQAADVTVNYKQNKPTGGADLDVVAGAVTLEDFGTLSLDLSGLGDSMTLEQIAAVRKEFTGKTEALPEGFIDLNGMKISDVKFVDDAKTQIDIDQLSKFKDFTDIVVDQLTNSTVVNVDANKVVQGNVGNIQAANGVTEVQVGQATLNKGQNGFATNKSGDLVDMKVTAGAHLGLIGGGEAGKITLENSDTGRDTTLLVSGGNTTIAQIDGKNNKETAVELASGVTTVENGVKVGKLNSQLGADLVVTKGNLELTATGDYESEFLGNVQVLEGEAITNHDITLLGSDNKFVNLTAKAGSLGFAGSTTVSGLLKGAADEKINVGYYDESDPEANLSGQLKAELVNLNGATLFLDPAYGSKASTAEIGSFTSKATKEDISTVNGNIYVGQNSALLVGSDLAEGQRYIARLQEANGSFNKDNVGSVLYVNAQQVLKDTKRIVIDADLNDGNLNGHLTTKYNKARTYTPASGTPATDTPDLYIGKNSVLALGDDANKADGAIKFESANASIFAEVGGKIVLDGASYIQGSRNVVLFTDAGADTANGVKVLENNIEVETSNGLLHFVLKANNETTGGKLELNQDKIDTAFNGSSAPMRDFLIGYTTLTSNWQESIVGQAEPEQKLLGDLETKGYVEVDAKTGNIVLSKKGQDYNAQATNPADKINPEDYALDADKNIHHIAYNDFLESVSRYTNGAAADQAARMGDFGGAAETALVATSTTYDAVAGRFGMGQQAGTMTIANNGQGSGLWVTPVYKSHESDGFDADGLGYGSDITLYGVALGGDVTLANGVRVGAMFNVGSGDADGQGAASVVSNDFDYFGGSIYAGYAIDNFSIVGDISYTTIDSDVEANTAAGKTSTSFDTTALSVGVTGQYALKVAEMDVTPHAGMRFTRIDMDDYTIESADFGEVGQYNASSANVFSIPVGVTISKEYVTDTWTVKPSFDLTLTGNFGDDTVDGTVSWTGVSNWDVSTKAEFVDNFTYGAAVGIAAKTGNFGLGLGLNYTGSSNTDEFGVNANARYMF
ncbi:autotransporter outer membrane beta-barrel domain-containing protein [Anaerobiospirillum sp. NML120448]|uniref:autotransporter domain-containing protein n=1 Tax=Anaerobiospirillum sp. NML120448 TaxID=2932816 RepID=UPI001FF2B271|nr:autotransporter outer membrane beta-barrel domain-containing protein [Anaerobiospirillum sp. NML120448]MCK0515498.1 autotransporter outer membrane beta-barrel domain-containing protein [Anaerobiospirillum sp. NML120448]